METLREMRDFLNSLSEDQLNQKPFMLGNPGQRAGNVYAYVLGEDYYYQEDGCFPKSALSEEDFKTYMEEEDGRIAWTADRVFFSINE